MIDIQWNPSSKDLKGFGFVILIGFGAIGLAKLFWPFCWGPTHNLQTGIVLVSAAILVGIPAILGWRIVLPAYWAWMGIAFVMGKIMFPLIFTVFFYLVFVPIGLVMKFMGHDPLQLRGTNKGSYWVTIEHSDASADYERQY